jgi:hypothetical protein
MYIYTISDSDTQLVQVESEVKLDVSSYSSKAVNTLGNINPL